MLPNRRNSAVVEPGNHREHPALFGYPEPGLESDQVPHLSRAVLAPELHHRERLPARPRLGKAHRLHRPEAERVAAAAGHLLDRQAPFEVRHLVELVRGELIGGEERIDERARTPRRPSARSGSRRPPLCRSGRARRAARDRANRWTPPARWRRRRRARRRRAAGSSAPPSASEVSGPVAITAGDGISRTSSRTTRMRGWDVTRSCTAHEKISRSTASAAPPGTRANSAHSSSRLPSRRSSALSSPCALPSSSDLKELLQTSSARRSVWCAGVRTAGRISYSVTSTPRAASAQAASQPASPPPTTTAVTSVPSPPARSPRPGART